jgi:biotin-(acetyl-CoA carboxylase) ligase
VRIERYDDVLAGTAIGVDPSGQLLVSADGETHLINVGDVVHLRIDESDNG